MLCFLNGKLENSNKKYGLIKKWKVAWKNSIYERNRLKAAIKAMLPIV